VWRDFPHLSRPAL